MRTPARYASTDTAPASRKQIEYAIALAYDGFPGVEHAPEAQNQMKINTLSALNNGASKKHCGVLIDKLKGSFSGEDRDYPKAAEAQEPEAAAITSGGDVADEPLPWDNY